MAEYEKKVREILKKHGYYFERHGKGDHDVWYNPVIHKSVSVDGKIKSRHSANGILREAGINFRFR